MASASASGAAVLLDGTLNHTFAFSHAERDALSLRGMVPAGPPQTLDAQVKLVMEGLSRIEDTLAKYEYIMRIKALDETLFYAALVKHTAALMPLVYTPTVGAACMSYSHLLLPRGGLFISLEDRGKVAGILRSWTRASTVRAICVTDGERILGLGDLGADGMGIPVGKLALYCALAGVPPAACLPVTLDCGTNNERLLADPAYTGLRRKRAEPHSEEYDGLVEEFVVAAQEVFGKEVLVQWEDFGNANAFRLLHKYTPRAVTFNDDIQGTASVVLAALEAASRVTGRPLADTTFVFLGAGEAGVGIADLIAYAVRAETGCDEAASRSKIWLVDSKGLVTGGRSDAARLAHHKLPYAHAPPAGIAPDADLRAIVAGLRPQALIGVSATPNSFTREVVAEMTAINERPIVFALSNPTSMAECTAEQAYKWSEGRALFASGSPFDPVHMEVDGPAATSAANPSTPSSTKFVPSQANNSFVFPAVGLATLAARITSITDHTFYVAARALAAIVTAEDLATGSLMPPLSNIREVSAVVAKAVVDDAFARGVAAAAKPEDTMALVKAAMWTPSY